MTQPTDQTQQLSSRPMGTITFEGNIGGSPTFANKPGEDGWSRLSFSVAHTERRRDPESGEWSDVDLPTWYRCTLWGKRAESLRELLASGIGVRVEGRLSEAHWLNQQGEVQFAYDVAVDSLTLVPYRIASVVTKNASSGAPAEPPQPPAQEPQPPE